MSQSCPCGTNTAYDNCCGRYHQGEPAPTAECLMRSRYSAYVVGDLDYISRTASGKALAEAKALEKPTEQTTIEWTQLKVVAKEDGGVDDACGTVTFSAYFRHGDQPLQVMHEKSLFKKIDGQWFYVDGEATSMHAQLKIPRNDPCPCGSGSKFKKCCGA